MATMQQKINALKAQFQTTTDELKVNVQGVLAETDQDLRVAKFLGITLAYRRACALLENTSQAAGSSDKFELLMGMALSNPGNVMVQDWLDTLAKPGL